MQSSDISTDDLLGFLDKAWTDAPDTANSLGEQLLAERRSALGLIAPVGTIVHVSKNSASQASGNYSPGNLTVRQIVNIWTRLIRDFNTLKQAVLDAANAAGCVIRNFDFDQTIFTAMVENYKLLSEATTRPDLTNLSLPSCGRVPEGVWAW